MKKKLRPTRVSIGAPEWMTTFADMMTLLLTFFILLFSTSRIETKKVFEMYKSFEKYFNLDVDSTGYSSQEVRLEKLPDELGSLGAPEKKETADDGRSMERGEAEMIDRYASLSRTESHDAIILQGEVLFARGSAVILDGVKPTLLRIAARLGRYGNRIAILGHTSPLPLDPIPGAVDHDELGYRRAKAIGRFLSGGDGDLAAMAREMLPHGGDRIAAEIIAVDPARFVYASRGYHSPAASGRLWEDAERNDRVEFVFLPEFIGEMGGR